MGRGGNERKNIFTAGNKLLRQCLLVLLVKVYCSQDTALGSVDGEMVMGSGV